MTRHETLTILAAALLAAAGFVSTMPTPLSVALACAGAVVAVCGQRVQRRELAALKVRA
ncbi:hypothetical protein [Deinococcus frigens]|uniref:hypothetical protein n=1 Tax=Deinococcus frigens TaxID=249403 RepID=UPI000AEA295C|nr:hypothetical protein [Deinococcus frigens]